MQLKADTQRDFAYSADRVWRIAGDFGGLAQWLPGISACRVEGSGAADQGGNAVRSVDVLDGSVTIERLETLDEANRTYSYSILQAKGLDASNEYHATLAVIPTGDNQCRVTWSARFRLPDSLPADKCERAQQRVTQMYALCLQSLDSVLANRAA